MIEMIAGVFGLPVKQPNGKTRVVAKGPKDGPFAASKEQEARLVSMKLARYVELPEEDDEAGAPIGFNDMPELPEGVTAIPEYSEESTAKELREIGKLCGLTFKVGMTKAEMVAALDEHIEANMVEGDELPEEDDAPSFDASEAVQ